LRVADLLQPIGNVRRDGQWQLKGLDRAAALSVLLLAVRSVKTRETGNPACK
jgi:hypothetical protein